MSAHTHEVGGAFSSPVPRELKHAGDEAFRAFKAALSPYVQARGTLAFTLNELLSLVEQHPDGAALYFDRDPLTIRIMPERRVRPIRTTDN